jgi:hypothetical protein
MKMEPIKCSETSAFSTQTPGRYPKENALHIKHGESFRSNILLLYQRITATNPMMMSVSTTKKNKKKKKKKKKQQQQQKIQYESFKGIT